MHLRGAEAWKTNPFMIISIPLMVLFIILPKFSKNVVVGKCVLSATLLYWLLRNLFHELM